MKTVIGIGNALVDLLIKLEDDHLLEELKLPKGSMTLVDEKIKNQIAGKSNHLTKEMASGGSAANTIHGLARLGISTAFLGTIGQDETGDFFIADLMKSNIKPILNRSATPSGLASTLISKNGERTFGTYLGASIELSANNILPGHFSGYDILHVEGYLVQNHELLETILNHASQSGLKISIDMASYNVVKENLRFFREMVEKYVDILFANEEEAKAYTGKSPKEALDEMAEQVEIAVIKTGANGSMAKRKNEKVYINALKTKVIDTTGAGDLYASGFLFGLIHNLSLEKSGNIGSLLASRIITNVGAKIREDQWTEILAEVDKIK